MATGNFEKCIKGERKSFCSRGFLGCFHLGTNQFHGGETEESSTTKSFPLLQLKLLLLFFLLVPLLPFLLTSLCNSQTCFYQEDGWPSLLRVTEHIILVSIEKREYDIKVN